MADIVTPEVRSRMMSGIRGKDTKPEILIRRALHQRGFRYLLHDPRLPGRPDLVLPRFRVALFINGCFWHGHDCSLFRLPKTRPEFWADKIDRNRQNDERNTEQLISMGWRVAQIWECSLRGKNANLDAVVETVSRWLHSTRTVLTVRGAA